MVSESFDRKIAEAHRHQETARQEAESSLESLVSATSTYVTELAKYMMDRALRDKAEVVEKLPQEKLSELKSSYNETLGQLPNLTQARIQAIEWPHRAEVPQALRTSNMASVELGRKAKESLEETVRQLLGRVGALLVHSGLADSKASSEWKSLGGGTVAYAYGLPDFGTPSRNQFKKLPDLYQQKLDAYLDASRSLYEAERAKQQALARNRWDQA
jgi:hypothetical protein